MTKDKYTFSGTVFLGDEALISGLKFRADKIVLDGDSATITGVSDNGKEMVLYFSNKVRLEIDLDEAPDPQKNEGMFYCLNCRRTASERYTYHDSNDDEPRPFRHILCGEILVRPSEKED